MKDNKYSDIINREHHISAKHPHMSLIDRAAQFSPFAALTGYEDAIEETGRLTNQRIELTEEEKQLLDRKLRAIARKLEEKKRISVELEEKKRISVELEEKKRIPVELEEKKRISAELEVEIIYYRPDERKSGGTYITITGKLQKVDCYKREMIIADNSSIAIDDIIGISQIGSNTDIE